jgi:predicted DNA-binding protein YlxM (UPF0122 family)
MKPPIPLKDLLRLYNVEKLPVTEIAARFKMTRQGIYQVLWRHKIRARPRIYRRKPPENRTTPDELHDLYWKQGLSLGKIGERFGVSATTIWAEMIRHGVPRRPKGTNVYPSPKYNLDSLAIGEQLLIDENPAERFNLQLSLYTQAKKLGIRIAIRNLNDRMFKVTRLERMSIEKITKMHGSGMSIRKIASAYSSSRQTITKMLKRHQCEKESQ